MFVPIQPCRKLLIAILIFPYLPGNLDKMKDSIKIAILGNCTTEYIVKGLQDASSGYDIAAEVYNAPYNQYVQEVLGPESGLYRSSPELVILWLEGRELFPEWYDVNLLLEEKEKKTERVRNIMQLVVSLVEAIHSRCSAKILIHNFKIPCSSPLGILDNKFHPGLKAMIAMLNTLLEEWACGRDGIYIFDYNTACAQYGMEKAIDKKVYYATKSPVSFPFIRVIATEYMRYILPIKSKNRKCLVLDLDNTLWGGIAGEDGLQGVALDVTGSGRAFYDFQQEILNLYNKGILLAVNSKNNPEDALEIIEKHPHMLLRKKYFSVLKINWNDKAANLNEISKELGIGIESIVFIDDNPVEREFVKAMLPEVTVVEMPEDTARYAETLERLPEFELLSITEDDLRRNEMYQANSKRQEILKNLNSMQDYLSGLELEITVEAANSFTIPRISQLSLKTNQFNMTTKRYQTRDIQKMTASEDYMVVSCSVKDKFGDSGISGVCIAKLHGAEATIDTFLLSCRVLGLGIEYAFLSTIIKALHEKGVSTIYAKYVKTARNSSNEGFYRNAGFSVDSADLSETSHVLNPGESVKQHDYIKIVKK
ncbi:MAG: HAD-IIIC family phosphatase [Ruminiclostridium sp.]|nr:HAD-IIIC family phosphatase [Ruminiclostridium sp.]